MPEQKPKRRALIVLLVAAVFLAVAFAGSIAYVVLRNVEITPASEEAGTAELRAVRARFKGQTPLVVMHGGTVPQVNHPDEALPRQTISTLHVRVWRPQRRDVIRLSFPSWVARLGGPKTYALDALHLDSMNLSFDDLERHGPGLIADFNTPDGAQVLVWCE